MAQVLVRDLSDEAVAGLKARARENRRSLQAELVVILERAARAPRIDFWEKARRLREELSGRPQTDSALLIAEDRAR